MSRKKVNKSFKRLKYICMIVLFFSISICFSQTSAQLVTQFSTLFKGRLAKIIWETRVSGQIYGNQVWGMDTKDCIPHIITQTANLSPASAQLYDPVMTWDQKRVLVTNGNNMTVYVVNWDGTGFKSLVSGYFSGYAWRQNNTTDWIIATPKTSPSANNASVYRINVDTPSVKVLLWNKTICGSGPSFHAGLSVDGTRMCENYPHPHMGIAKVPNGSVYYKAVPDSSEICVPSMSQDNKYQCLCFSQLHNAFIIFDTTCIVSLNKDFTGALPFNTTTNQAHWIRWSNDNDIATVDNYVVRISDLQKVDLSGVATLPVAIQVAFYGNTKTIDPERFNTIIPRRDSPLTLYNCIGEKLPFSIFTSSGEDKNRNVFASGLYFMKNGDETKALSIQGIR
jgi:hypothetical protein